jgi:ribonucleoside-diphosphate reductase alpha chain
MGNPYYHVKFEKKHIKIFNKDNQIIFEKFIEFPVDFDENAAAIVASRYLCNNVKDEELSIKQMFNRVTNTISKWAKEQHYFIHPYDMGGDEDPELNNFNYLLKKYQIDRLFAFNSPVYFNVGFQEKPQTSACQPGYSLINTQLGYKTIQEIVDNNMVGLKIQDSFGETEIVAVKNNGIKPVYRITLENGFTLDTTADHLVCADTTNIRNKSAKKTWKPVGNLKNEYLRIYHKNSITKNTTQNDDILISEAALAGWAQTDGFVGKYSSGTTNKSWILEFETINNDEFNWVIYHLDKVFPLSQYNRNIRNANTTDPKIDFKKIRLYGNKLFWFIQKYDLADRRILKHVPKIMYSMSDNIVSAYLKSIFQADSHIDVKRDQARCQIILNSMSKQFLQGIQLLLTRFGIITNWAESINRLSLTQEYHITISYMNNRQKFIDSIGFISNEKISKLALGQTFIGKNCFEIKSSKIRSIELIGDLEVFDIQTKSGEYLSNSILIHNCFILSINDNMESITELSKTEAKIFKRGSGSGVNLSNLRSSKEEVSGGGKASGPVSFLKAHDVLAGVIKSGGTLRRSAKLACLNIEHPDIEEFIDCKIFEEEKLAVMRNNNIQNRTGYDLADEVFFQNTNISVRIPDDFMLRVITDQSWSTKYVKTGEIHKTYSARSLLRKIAKTSWKVADPGIQFHDTVNKWNTLGDTEVINASNPCSEFLSIDDTSCNLASINLIKFFEKPDDYSFNSELFNNVIQNVIKAQDILIDNSEYPNEKITINSKKYRNLGLGYTNLGGLLMWLGLPYDSKEGRHIAALITAAMTGTGFNTSADLADKLGPFEEFEKNKHSFMKVLDRHFEEVQKLLIPDDTIRFSNKLIPIVETLVEYCKNIWNEVMKREIFRNAQISLLAPTGTISSIMNSITTGIEPEYSLVRYKRLAGSDGATLKYTNSIIPESLKNLGYSEIEIPKIIDELINETKSEKTLIKPEHLDIFLTAANLPGTDKCINYMGHLKMCAAVQPFLSGAISKTINVPKDCTVDDLYNLYIEAWKLGLKGVTIYRDGSKNFQPLSTCNESNQHFELTRKKLPAERSAITHKFKVGNSEGYLTCGMYPETSKLGEIFINISKEGSVLSGFADALATIISISLQYGVPLKDIVNKLSYLKFEPNGFTSNPDIRIASSIVDYIARYIGMKFLSKEDQEELGLILHEIENKEKIKDSEDGECCPNCGSLMRKLGSCYLCVNCGYNAGSCG